MASALDYQGKKNPEPDVYLFFLWLFFRTQGVIVPLAHREHSNHTIEIITKRVNPFFIPYLMCLKYAALLLQADGKRLGYAKLWLTS